MKLEFVLKFNDRVNPLKGSSSNFTMLNVSVLCFYNLLSIAFVHYGIFARFFWLFSLIDDSVNIIKFCRFRDGIVPLRGKFP